MYNLLLYRPSDAPNIPGTEVCDSASCGDNQIATIWADEAPVKGTLKRSLGHAVGWDFSDSHRQNLILLRRLVTDANAAERLRAALTRIIKAWDDNRQVDDVYDEIENASDLLAELMPDVELDAKAIASLPAMIADAQKGGA